MTYTVLDAEFRQSSPAQFAELFASFAAGYSQAFEGDEAEPTSEWPARIAGSARPQPILRIVVATEDGDRSQRVIAGACAEYYRTAGCVLMTYLYVSDTHRHRGYARELLARALTACEALGDVRVVLAEAEWPELLRSNGAPPGQIATARERLRFFARIGARMINIDYVQPQLGAGKHAVSYLRLLRLPLRAAGSDDALASALEAFLPEFFAALARQSGTAADEAALERMRRQVSAARPLTSSLPRLQLTDAAICFHFVEPLEPTNATDAFLNSVREYRCPVLHSMETDLLSRAYRMRPLFRTVCMTQTLPHPSADAGFGVEIAFPERVMFQSESRMEARYWPLRRRRVRAYLTASFFFEPRVVVWHVTLRTDARSARTDAQQWLDELDLISLLKLADDGAEQEQEFVPGASEAQKASLEDSILFSLTDDASGTALGLGKFLRALAAGASKRDARVPLPRRTLLSRAATVQLLGRPTASAEPFFGLSSVLEREALCGVITSILDFDEIDDAEARDTLTPSVPLDDALLRVHRGALVYIAEDDRAARTVAGTVGISPYLIIPHATVLCNEYLLEGIEGPGLRDGMPRSVGVLSTTVKQVEDTLRRKWVPNAFFYSTEQKLYECALVESGAAARRANAEDLLLRLKTNLQLLREWQRERFEAVVAGLLATISVMSLDSLVVELTPPALKAMTSLNSTMTLPVPSDPKLLGHGLTFLLAVVVGLAVCAWKRPRGTGW